MSQKMFIEEFAPALGYDTTFRAPESILIKVRFVTTNPANTADIWRDNVDLVIISSNEDATSLCETDLTNIAVDPDFTMIGKHYYQVKDGEEEGWEKAIFVRTQLTGVEGVPEECAKLLKRSVDIQNANGNWVERWSEWWANADGTTDGWYENYRIESQGGLSSMIVSLTHEEFVDLAKEYGSSLSELTLDLRIAYKDASRRVFAEDPFTLKFTDSGKVSECATATMAFESVTGDLALSFVGEMTEQEVNVPRAMRTKFAPEFKNCSATYQLYAFNENDDEY
jgi:hypothetical protein